MKSALDRTKDLLLSSGHTLEASIVLLPDKLTPKERELAKEALCEASAILCDAATRVAMKPADE